MTPMSTLAFAAGLSLALNACAQPAPSPATGTTPAPAAGSGALRVETVATGLEHPWSVALLPEGGFLVSERPGRLRRIGADGQVSAPIAGVPEVFAQGQGGLLDVVLDPGYAGNRRIWLSYAEPGDGDTAGTAVATATLAGDALTDLVVRYRQLPKLEGSACISARASPSMAPGMCSSARANATGGRWRRTWTSCRASWCGSGRTAASPTTTRS